MTPIEFLRIEAKQKALIKKAEKTIRTAREEADKCLPPLDELRECQADDIRPGVIVWHEREVVNGGWFWNVVDKPQAYGDDFKAYLADDGCRYGLLGAWVYK